MDYKSCQIELDQIKAAIKVNDLLKDGVTSENKDVISEKINVLNQQFPKVMRLLDLGHITNTQRDELKSKIDAALEQCKNSVMETVKNMERTNEHN